MSAGATDVVILGGGLAGLAAAWELSRRGLTVELYEARRTTGGRATSFRDPATGAVVDHCQHAALGCCTNFLDFVRQVGLGDEFRAVSGFAMLDPDGRRSWFGPTAWLPAPLHLGPSLLGAKYLNWRDRIGVVQAMRRLLRMRPSECGTRTVGEWLEKQRQSSPARQRFWGVVLASALGEDLERASLSVARKVFVDGFFAHRQASTLHLPRRPLSELIDGRMGAELEQGNCRVHRGAGARRLVLEADRCTGFIDDEGATHRARAVIVAVPWRKIGELIPDAGRGELPWLDQVSCQPGAPITGVHLWFDRDWTTATEIAFTGMTSQWLFAGDRDANESSGEVHLQVVVSASYGFDGRRRDDVVQEIMAELGALFPRAREAKLLASRVVTDPLAVFTPSPEFEAIRPAQRSDIPGLYLAGDWTRTGWPATMESAVRSGRLAASAALQDLGRGPLELTPDLPRSWLVRQFVGD